MKVPKTELQGQILRLLAEAEAAKVHSPKQSVSLALEGLGLSQELGDKGLWPKAFLPAPFII
jgi:hypothetical protein